MKPNVRFAASVKPFAQTSQLSPSEKNFEENFE